jgi:two-component sensor histidine kinase/PAS domain-containing protein
MRLPYLGRGTGRDRSIANTLRGSGRANIRPLVSAAKSPILQNPCVSLKPPDYTFDDRRLAALDSFGILDTPAESGFDDMANLASLVCEAPVALVSLVARDRQWFKARVGFDECQTDLGSSVCAHALVEPDLLVIPDLTRDPRSRDNPLVTGDPRIRFYAGAPIRTAQGDVLGSLCVIDTKPRPGGLTDSQSEMLRALARQVMSQLELRRALLERDAALARQRESEAQFRFLFEGIQNGFCIVEMRFEGGAAVDYRFVEANSAFDRQTGLVGAKGRWMREISPGHEQYWFDLYGKVALTGEPINFQNHAAQLGGRWFDVQAFRVGDPAANRVGILFNDITKQKAEDAARLKGEATQTVVNHELSHRMKNMFAMVQAIAQQTLRKASDREAVDAFNLRIQAMSAAHDILLEQNWAAAELGGVVKAVLGTLVPLERFDIQGPDVELGARATLSISLLLHELAANALKHGALSDSAGRVFIRWSLKDADLDRQLLLSWHEAGGPPVAKTRRRGFGSRLIEMGLVGTGGAELRYDSSGLMAEFMAPLAQVQLS